ncbi:MAG: hypothetical protein IT379_01920 [Deltaproteobacteria bacterium]|nr:hypothetical protein [Deltaproteobacteria bacterium]
MLRLLFGFVLAVAGASCATAECANDSDCPLGRYCGAGDCKQDCASDDHCPLGLVCGDNGRCSRSAADAATPDGATPLDAFSPDTATPDARPPEDAGPIPDLGPTMDVGPPPPPPADVGPPPPPPPDMGPTGTRAYLEPCAADGECASGRCVSDGPGTTSRVCSRACARDADCADWHFCLSGSPGGAGTCAWDDVGNPCSGAASGDECAFACVHSDSPGSGHCTHLCERGSDCPGGYACVLSDALDPTSLRVCAWIHKACPVDATQCPTSLGGCGPDGSGSTEGTQCTGACLAAADCPAIFGGSYTCGTPPGFPAGLRICEPPTAADGASGEPCTTDDDCRSGICAFAEAGDPTAVCLERCVPGVGCAVGFGCTPVVLTGTGAAANVCVPAGRGRTGDPCTRARDCRSGACSSSARACIDTCQSGACPPGFTCTPEGLTVEGVALRTCRP